MTGWGFGNRKGGFFAEFAAIDEGHVSPIPPGLSFEEAGALAVSGITALQGLDELGVEAGQTIMIFGASGGVGHVAVQLAKHLGLHVFAIASKADGVALAHKVGADWVAEGHSRTLLSELNECAPGVNGKAYDGESSRDAFARLDELIARGPFHIEVSRLYPLDATAQALRDVQRHHVGKLAIQVATMPGA